MTDLDHSTLDRLLARQEIHDALMAYARGVDRHDVGLMQSAYHPDAIDDHGFFKMNAWEMAAMAAPESDAPILSAWTVTQHLILNLYVELEGEKAQSESYFYVVHRFDHDGVEYDLIMRGRYVDQWERRSGGPFKIADRKLIFDSFRTDAVAGRWPGPDPSVPKWAWGDEMAVSTDGVTWGVVGRGDPSYRLLRPARADLGDPTARLVARQDIDDALMAYARGVDRHDVDLIRSAFHPDTIADFGFFKMNAWEAAAMAAPNSDASIKTAWIVTQHLMLNRFVQLLDDDSADSETYFMAVYRFEHGGTEYDMVLRGRYLDRWERRDGGPLKIAERTEIWDTIRTDAVTGRWPGPDPAVPKWAWGDEMAVSTDGVTWGAAGAADPSCGLLRGAAGLTPAA